MVKNSSFFKDYSFSEWQQLPYEVKRDIWNHYWDKYNPAIGKSTRNAILAEFKSSFPQLSEQALDIGYGYFGWDVGCIYIVVPQSKIRVPEQFASVFVNKGFVQKKVDESTFFVKWRYGGSSSLFRLKVESKEQGE